jgi:hypothetical protein
MRIPSLLIALVLAGCYAPDFDAGRFHCSAKGECPSGHHCAADGYCWKNGEDPTLDLGADLAVAGDLSPSLDLSPPPVLPAERWLSAGGGSVTSGATQLNFSVGGGLEGSSVAASGASLSFGNLCSDSTE